MSNVVMGHKSAFLQQGGPLGPDDLEYVSLHVGVEGGIPPSHSLLHPVPKLDFFWRQQVVRSSLPSRIACIASYNFSLLSIRCFRSSWLDS